MICPKCGADTAGEKTVDKKKKTKLFVIIGCAAALIVAALILILTLGGKDGIVGTWKTSLPVDKVISILADELKMPKRIVAFCQQDATEEEILAAEERIRAQGGVESVVRITKAEALEKMKEQAGENADLYSDFNDENNPLSDSFEITYTSDVDVDNLRNELFQIEIIRKVNSRADLSKSLSAYINSLINSDDELEMTFEFKDDGTYRGGFDEDRVREVIPLVFDGRFDRLNFNGSYTYENGKLILDNAEVDYELDGDTLTFRSISGEGAENNPLTSDAILPIVFTRS